MKVVLSSVLPLALIAGVAAYIFTPDQPIEGDKNLPNGVERDDVNAKSVVPPPAPEFDNYPDPLRPDAERASIVSLPLSSQVVKSKNIGPDIDVDDVPQQNHDQDTVRDIGEDIDVDDFTMSMHARSSVTNIGPDIDVDQMTRRTGNSPARNIGPDIDPDGMPIRTRNSPPRNIGRDLEAADLIP